MKKSKVISAAFLVGTAALGLTACGNTQTVTKPVYVQKIVVKTVPGPTTGPTITKTVIRNVPGPTIIKTVIRTVPTPAPTEGTLLNFSGSGTQQTPSFTVGGNGDYTISWTYSGNIDSSGGSSIPSNFMIDENTAGSGSDTNASALPNDIAASGSGNCGVFSDAGTHTFNVQAIGSWTVKVVSAP